MLHAYDGENVKTTLKRERVEMAKRSRGKNRQPKKPSSASSPTTKQFSPTVISTTENSQTSDSANDELSSRKKVAFGWLILVSVVSVLWLLNSQSVVPPIIFAIVATALPALIYFFPPPWTSRRLSLSRREFLMAMLVVGVPIGIGFWQILRSLLIGSQNSIVGHSPASPPLGTTVAIYRGHKGPVLFIAWSPDGGRIASAGQDATVQVWEATTGNKLLTYNGHTGPVNTLTWAPDGTYLASGGEDKTVQVWDPTTASLLTTFHGHKSAVTAITWSYRFQQSGIASGDTDGTIRLWNYTSPTEYTTFSNIVPVEIYTSGIDVLKWSPYDGTTLATEIEGEVFLWDTGSPNAAPITPSPKKEYYGLVWSPDGKRIALGECDFDQVIAVNAIDIWNPITGQIKYYQLPCFIGNTPAAHLPKNPINLAWSPDGKRLASGTSNIWGYHGPRNAVLIWDVEDGGHPYLYRSHHAQVLTAAWSPDGTFIASAGDDETVHVWRAK